MVNQSKPQLGWLQDDGMPVGDGIYGVPDTVSLKRCVKEVRVGAYETVWC